MSPKPKGKAKVKAKAKGEPAPKRQRTCAQADTVPEDAEGAIVLANAGMGALQFHRAATKMRGLLKYRASAKCLKAYISLYM